MSVNIKPVQQFKRVSIMYQKSLPEGNIDLTRCFNSFKRQMKPHQELSTAEKQNGNLGRRRERIDLITHFTVNCVYISFSACGPGWLPRDFWVHSGRSDAEVCWTLAPSAPPLDCHSSLLCPLQLLTQCLPLLVVFHAVGKQEEGCPLNSTTDSSPS